MLHHFLLFVLGPFTVFMLLSGLFLFWFCQAFVALKVSWWARSVLFLTLALSASMVIWLGDNNFALTLPFYMAAFLASTTGDLLGRITVGSIFFCFIMSLCAMTDTYLIPIDRLGYYDIVTKAIRPLIFGISYLLFRRHLPATPVQLPHHLWKLCAGLTCFLMVTLSVLILPAYWMPDSILLHNFNWFQGTIILPMAFVGAVVVLCSILVLADYEKKAQAANLAKLREVYYQTLQQEQNQVRTLRHDLRNHLSTVLGLLERGDSQKARHYLQELTDSPALRRSHRICENEIVNVVIAAKLEAMEQYGILPDFQISLPSRLPIADIDLCALLGNALDNALEATQKAEIKKIVVRCKIEQGLFMLRVNNPLSGKVTSDLSTTKQDKAHHGFGLAGMREIVSRYGGALAAQAKGSQFELIVSIPTL